MWINEVNGWLSRLELTPGCFSSAWSLKVKYHCVKAAQFLFLLGSIYPHVLRYLVVWGCLQIEIPHEHLGFSDGLNIFGVFIVIIRLALVTIEEIDNLDINVTTNSKCALAASSKNSLHTTVGRYKKQCQIIREDKNRKENY